MQPSWLERLKSTLVSILPFPGELFLLMAGLGCYLGTCAILRRPLSWAWALVPGLVLSLAIEGWEIQDHWGASGFALRGQTLAILGRHLKDVAIMNVPPAAIVATAYWLDRTAPPI